MHRKQLEKELIKYSPQKFRDKIEEGIQLAAKYHEGQTRLSGDPFIYHALRTAITLAKMGLDTTTILAGLLHNSISLNPTEKSKLEKEIESKFTEDVLYLLEGCDQISRATSSHDTDYEIITKFILNQAQDLRPILIKLADSLDNVRTIEYMPSNRIGSKIQKIFGIYGPLAEYLNLDDIKKELEEKALEIYRPEIYQMISKKLESQEYTSYKSEEYIKYLKKITSKINPRPAVVGRIKSIHSIYNKQKKYLKEGLSIDLSNIEDLMAFRLVTDSEDNCFNILEILMDNGELITEKFDDYITYPKKNGYKSLQGPVVLESVSKNIVEVQILTYDMYYHNTYGPASHIAYKESKSRYANPTDKFNWVEQVHKAMNNNTSSREKRFSVPIKVDIFTNKVYSYTPKGKIIQLEKGDRPLDFAYRVHTDIGNSMVSAKVNGLSVRLDYEVKTGDTIEIKTQAGKKSVREDWIKYAHSPSTHTKIQRSWKNK